jgi:hypothetical protein
MALFIWRFLPSHPSKMLFAKALAFNADKKRLSQPLSAW